MANKFQKSVMERLEQEAVRQKKNTGKKGPVITAASGAEAKKTVAEKQRATETQATKADTVDLGQYLRHEPQRLAKNKTFYLDDDVIEAIKRNARVQGVTDSKLVNGILSNVLQVYGKSH